jgi:hypothetical protein
LKRKYGIYVWYAKTKTIKMAASNVTYETSSIISSSPSPSQKTLLDGRKSKKNITIDLPSISSLLNKRRDDTINTINIANIINITQDEGKDEYCRDDDCLNNNNNIEAEAEVDAGGGNNGYYYRNREKKLEYQKNYNREQGDKIKNYNKDYYQKRRDEILEKAKTKIICECGCEVQLFNMNSHKKTKKHAKALVAINAKI